MTTEPLPAGLSKYCLSQQEKIEIRSCILSFCARNPVCKKGFWLESLLKTLHLAPVTATLIVFATTSVGALAYAAEETVPGDNLYGFKVGVSEPLIGMFYMNQEARGKWDLRRMERRLLEAERLAMMNKGNDPGMRTLLTQHMTDQERLAERLMDRARDFSDPQKAEEYREELQSMLEAHSALLTAVAARDPGSEADVVAFAERIGAAQEQNDALRMEVAALAEPLEKAIDLQEDAQQMQKNIDRLRAVSRTAEEAEDVRSDIRQMQHELNAVEAALEAGQLSRAEDLIRAGRRRVRELNSAIAMQSDTGVAPPSQDGTMDDESDGSEPAIMLMMATASANTSSSSSQTATGSSASSAKSGSAVILEDLPL